MKRNRPDQDDDSQDGTSGVARYTQHNLPWDRVSKRKRATLIGKPSIPAENPDLAKLAKQVWRLIKDMNNPPFLFRREGNLCRIEAGDSGAPVPVHVNVQRLNFLLAEAFD